MLEAIIFDFDGVIADTYELNLKVYRDFYPDIARKEFEDLHTGNPLKKRDWSDEKAIIFAQKQRQLFSQKHFFKGMDQLIKDLANKFKLFVISSSDDANIKEYLSLKDLNDYFIQVLGANTHKSKVEKFKLIMNQYDFGPDEILFVTDTVGDIKEAQVLNIPTVAVTWGYHDEKLLNQAHPQWLVSNLRELRSLIQTVAFK